MSKISDELNCTISEFPDVTKPIWKAYVDTKNYTVQSKNDKHISCKSPDNNVISDIVDNLKKQYNKEDKVMNKSNEVVNDPSHYCSKVSKDKMKYIIDRIVKRGYIEVIDIIDAFDLNFNIGNSVKYELRLGRKDDSIIEIDKAIKYLEFEKEMILADCQKCKNN